MIHNDNITQSTDEEKEEKLSLVQKILEPLETPTLQYIWKGKKTIKNKDGEPIKAKVSRKKRGVLIAIIKDDKVAIGFSLCNFKKGDRFNYVGGLLEPDFGISVALERAEKWKDLQVAYVGPADIGNGKRVVAIPHSLIERLESFVEKCKGYKRYKDKSFPVWIDTLEEARITIAQR